MSNELVQTVKFLLLHWERLPKIREASADFIKKLDPFMKDLDPTLIVARQVNLELVNVIDRVFAFVKYCVEFFKVVCCSDLHII